MNKSEFLLLIPGLIYGVGLVDLIKVINRKMYWEILVWAMALFLILIVQWFALYEKMEQVSANMGLFSVMLLSPLVYTRACYILTPEEADTDTKKYFYSIRKAFYFTLVLIVVVNESLQYLIDYVDNRTLFRIIILPFFLACAIYDKLWIRSITAILLGALLIYVIIDSSL